MKIGLIILGVLYRQSGYRSLFHFYGNGHGSAVAFSTSGISAVLESAVQILFCRINGRITCCLTNGTALAPEQEL